MTTEHEHLFKFLGKDGQPYHGGQGQWNLPSADGPGDWMPALVGRLEPCRHGYHLCRLQDLPQWPAPALFEAEYRGERIDCDDKIIVREARLLRRLDAWNERTLRVWACDCAERVLPLYERAVPGDTRVRESIAVARRFVNGQASEAELDAARSAAWASEAAAWSVAEAATWSAEAATWSAEAAAWAARDAAEAAAWGAWSAAWSAAGSAARAAEAASWVSEAAAGSAARAAAGSAVFQTERRWQLDRLMEYVDGTAT